MAGVLDETTAAALLSATGSLSGLRTKSVTSFTKQMALMDNWVFATIVLLDQRGSDIDVRPHSTTKEGFMKKALALLLLGASLASCTATEQGAGIGAASGAIIGGAVTGNVRGAAVGAAIGGVSGAVIGNVAEQPGQCYYRDRYGRRYIDDCPRRY
jgi:uncharacterized membrane protein